MNDWVTAGIVAILAAAPLSVLLLAIVDVLPLPVSIRARRALKLGAAIAAAPIGVAIGFAIWSASGAAHLKPLCAAYAEPVYRASNPVPAGVLRLDVERTRAQTSRWFVIEREHYRLIDTRYGTEIASADEFWIDAGRTRHHCGIGSGPRPVAETTHPHNDRLVRFVERARRGTASASNQNRQVSFAP